MAWIEMSFQDTNIDSVGNHSGRRINAWVDELHRFGNEKIRVFLSISFYVDSINRLNRKPYLQRPFVRESKIPLNQCVWCFEKFIRFNAAVGFVDNTLLISFLCNFISLVTKTIRRTLVKLLSSAKLYGMPLFFSSLRLEIVFHFEIGWNCAP